MARAFATTVLLVCGCSGNAPPAPAPRLPPAQRVTTAAPPPPALQLSPAPAAEPVRLSILEPASGNVLAPAGAAATPIKVHSSRPDWILELALDGRRLRPVTSLPEQPTLGDLSDGTGVNSGQHYLVAALRADEHAPARYALSRFSVESAYSGVPSIVYCGRPSGTSYGSDQPLLLDFLVEHPGVDERDLVLVRARRRGSTEPAREARLDHAEPRLMHGIVAGDWSIELELLGSDNLPLSDQLSRHSCELTVNEIEAP